MQIKGIDFTSAPSRKKPITCAVGTLNGTTLVINQIKSLYDFNQFEVEIAAEGAWLAGMDFPFGLARCFIDNIGWPQDWQQYIKYIGSLSRAEYVALLEDYKRDRKAGDKEHRRICDRLASAISPQKLYGVPVAKMLYEGAPRILASPARIPPFRNGDPQRTIIEVYPALIARRCLGKASYKNEQKARQTKELLAARTAIVDCLTSAVVENVYGISVELGQHRQSLIADASGDHLDAVLCAIQAAWGYLKRDNRFGIPIEVDRLEGWIVDPMFAT